MTEQTFETVLRKYVNAGVPSSGAHNPIKDDLIDTLQGRVGYAVSGREVVKTANYTIVAGDAGWTVIANLATAITFALDAVATIAAAIEANTQFQCRVFNIGAGTLTVDPDGSETINGAATLTLAQYEGATIWTDGTSWRADVGEGSATLSVASVTAMKAIDPDTQGFVYLREDGRQDWFDWNGSDLSSVLTPTSATTTTVDSTGDICTAADHGFEQGHAVYPTTSVNGLTAETVYYVIEATASAIQYDAETSAFTAGQTLTGGTSGATATIDKVIDNGTTGILIVSGVSGTFQDNETITDGGSGSATSNGAVFTRADPDKFQLASSYDNAQAGTAFDLTGTTNFTLNRFVDPLEAVYVIPTAKAKDGSEGAFVRRGTLRSLIDIRWGGASCDGSTDDVAVINQVIDLAAALGGGTAVIPEGDTAIENEILAVSHVNLEGMSIRATRILANGLAAGKAALRAKSITARTDYCRIEGIQFKGDATSLANATYGLHMRACFSWHVSRVLVQGFGSAALYMFGEFNTGGGVQNGGETARCSFESSQFFYGDWACRITGTDNSGAPASDRSLSGTCALNKFVGCRFSGADNDGLLIEFGYGNTFFGCDFQANGRDGVRVGWWNNHFFGGHAENNGTYGFNALNNTETWGNVFIGNGASSNTSGDYNDGSDTNTFWMTGGAGQSGLKLGAFDTDNIAPGAIFKDSDGLLRYKDTDSVETIVSGGNVAFHAVASSTQSNATGNGTEATVTFGSELLDRGADFASNTFTAPVTGIYQLNAMVTIDGLTAAADTVDLKIVTSNRTYLYQWRDTNDEPNRMSPSISVLADMDASDTAHVTITVTGEAGDVVDILGGATGTVYTSFSGHLVG
jgi:hypothetical protein